MSNSSSNSSSLSLVPPGLLNVLQLHLAVLAVNAIMLPVALAGTVTNLVNIKTFLSMGVEDSITVSFLSLASSDCVGSLATLGLYVVGFAMEPTPQPVDSFFVHPRIPTYFFTQISICMSTSNILTTLYIALARCMCVVKPLQFKSIFTRSLSIVVVVSINAFAIVVYMPIFAHSGTAKVFNSLSNQTRIILWLSPSREDIKDIVFMIIRTVLPQSAQVILIICVLVMAKTLLQSIRFRQSAAATSGVRSSQDQPDDTENQTNPQQGKGESVKLSGKELQAVQQVFLISLVFILCNTPTIITSFVGLLVPGFDLDRSNQFYRTYVLVYIIQRGLEQINSSINIIFYYRYNTKYRNCLRNRQ